MTTVTAAAAIRPARSLPLRRLPRRDAFKWQHALIPRAGPHQMGQAFGQLGEPGLGVLIGIDPVARRQFVEKSALWARCSPAAPE